jgi:hypothetical protein
MLIFFRMKGDKMQFRLRELRLMLMKLVQRALRCSESEIMN